MGYPGIFTDQAEELVDKLIIVVQTYPDDQDKIQRIKEKLMDKIRTMDCSWEEG